MKILFYLPVITPRWFERIIVPLIEKLAGEHDVHVLAPVAWRGTGVGERELAQCAHLPKICWHVVNDQNHPSLRTDPVERDGVIAFVEWLEPDYVLCRSADFETVKAFPGIVRQITEGAADPLPLPRYCVHLTDCPFDHAVLPDLDGNQLDALNQLIEPFWSKLEASTHIDETQRSYLREWSGLPNDRPTLFLPLEYEHEENFFTKHRVGETPNAELLAQLAEQYGDRVFFAVTNHPLNELHVDNSALNTTIAAHKDCMRLLSGTTPLGGSTSHCLAREADGMLLGDSKMYALAAFLGTPVIRRSRFKTGRWMNAYDEIEAFLEAVEHGSCAAPDQAAARTWFAYHTANNLIDPTSPDLTETELLERVDQPLNPGRWQRNFSQFSRSW